MLSSCFSKTGTRPMSEDENVFRLFDPLVRICAADPDDRKPVVVFRLDRDTLNRKELSFDVI